MSQAFLASGVSLPQPNGRIWLRNATRHGRLHILPMAGSVERVRTSATPLAEGHCATRRSLEVCARNRAIGFAPTTPLDPEHSAWSWALSARVAWASATVRTIVGAATSARFGLGRTAPAHRVSASRADVRRVGGVRDDQPRRQPTGSDRFRALGRPAGGPVLVEERQRHVLSGRALLLTGARGVELVETAAQRPA